MAEQHRQPRCLSIIGFGPPFFSLLGGIGYLLVIQFPSRVDFSQYRTFNVISVLTLASLAAGILSGIALWGVNSSRTFQGILWVCIPTILLLTALHNRQLLVKSVLIPRDACINNARRIEAAKVQWAQQHSLTNGAEISWNDVAPHFPKGLPKCPEGGVYVLGTIGQEVRCSNPNHQVPP